MIFSLSAWLAAVVHVAARTSRWKAGGQSLYPSDLLVVDCSGRLKLDGGRSVTENVLYESSAIRSL